MKISHTDFILKNTRILFAKYTIFIFLVSFKTFHNKICVLFQRFNLFNLFHFFLHFISQNNKKKSPDKTNFLSMFIILIHFFFFFIMIREHPVRHNQREND